MIHFKLYTSVSQLPESWNDLAQHDVFLSKALLEGLEQAYPENISVYYLAVFKDGTIVGIAILQRIKMYLNSVFRDNSSWIKQQTTAVISKIAKGNLLVLGNLMHTGQHGFYFDVSQVKQKDFLETTYNAIEELSKIIKKSYGKTIRLIAFKDYFLDDTIHNEVSFFKEKQLYQVQVQPNMLFPIQKEWQSIEDYTLALKKKYKRRFKTALKKKAPIVSQPLSLEDLKTHEDVIYKLYKTVSDNAGVNSFVLPKHHFYELKKALKEQFIVTGYFIENEMVGFFTLIKNLHTLETYFLGYNHSLNHQHQLYLNMLYDMVNYGVSHQFKNIVFARTAMEIKSSVGAKPQPMVLYVKHTNHAIANLILKGIVKYLNPLKPWQERHPFK